MDNYLENTKKFMKNNGVTMSIKLIDKVYNPWKEEQCRYWHNKYKVVIKRNGKQMTVNFYDSAYNTREGIEPNEYDILSCIQKYNPYSFEDFCKDYGYNIDSCKDYKAYLAVQKEYNNVERVFGDILEELCEIN